MKLFVAVFLALVASGSAALVCRPTTCLSMFCAPMKQSACDGRFDPTGGLCGCCPVCKRQIREKAGCAQLLIPGSPQDLECADGLFCNATSRLCEKKTCRMELAEVTARLDAAKQAGKPLLGVPVPSCETDGTYKPVQCTGSVCSCVNKRGETIFADPSTMYTDDRWHKASMNCRCAVDQHEYMKKGLIGKLFYCEKNGNYKKVACTGSVCYCADEFGKQVGTSSVNIGQLGSLNC